VGNHSQKFAFLASTISKFLNVGRGVQEARERRHNPSTLPIAIRDKEEICGHVEASAPVKSTIICMYDRQFRNMRDYYLSFMQNIRYSKSTLSKIKFFRLNPFIISEMNYASDEQNA
jgi:hypothetical protein